jgi:hypothetical protein
LPARVTWTRFHGSHYEIGARCDELGDDVLLRVPTPPGALLTVRPGSMLRLTLPTEALAVLPDDGTDIGAVAGRR